MTQVQSQDELLNLVTGNALPRRLVNSSCAIVLRLLSLFGCATYHRRG